MFCCFSLGFLIFHLFFPLFMEHPGYWQHSSVSWIGLSVFCLLPSSVMIPVCSYGVLTTDSLCTMGCFNDHSRYGLSVWVSFKLLFLCCHPLCWISISRNVIVFSVSSSLVEWCRVKSVEIISELLCLS